MRIAALCFMLTLSTSACSKGGTTPSTPAGPGSQPVAVAPVDVAPPTEAIPAVDTPVEPVVTTPVAVATPAELFAACEDRLEQPEAAGECTSNAQCAPAGCSSEKCITKVSAADLMSTCEMLPCFEVVEACTCVQGACRWSVKAELPTKPMIQLPK